MTEHERFKRGDLVYVETIDIEHEGRGWEDVNVIAKRKAGRYYFVGWVISDKKKFLSLAAVASSRGTAFCSVRLPKGPGMSTQKLEVVKTGPGSKLTGVEIIDVDRAPVDHAPDTRSG